MNLTQLIFDKMVESKNHPQPVAAPSQIEVRHTPAASVSPDAVNSALGSMIRTAYNTTEHPITSGKRFPVGKALVFIRKVARKLFMRPYADPIIHQQNQFNAAAYQAAEELKNNQLVLEDSFAALRDDTVNNVQTMDRMVQEVRQLQQQTADKLFAHEVYANGEIALHTQRDDALQSQLTALTASMSDLDAQHLARTEALSERLDAVDAAMRRQADEQQHHQRDALNQQLSFTMAVSQLTAQSAAQAEQSLQRHTHLCDKLDALCRRADESERCLADAEAQRNALLGSVSQCNTRLDALDALQLRTDELERRLAAADAQRDALLAALSQSNARLDALEAAAAQPAPQPAVPALPEGAHLTASQAGEDRIIEWVLAEGFGLRGEACTYLDIGANHAVHLSNTYRFYHQGARGTLVEANPALIDELRSLRPGDEVIHACVDHSGVAAVPFYCLNGDGLSSANADSVRHAMELNPMLSVTGTPTVETITMEQLISRLGGKAPAILNVDVEGKEMEVLEHIDLETFRPKVIVTEMVEYQLAVSLDKNQSLVDYMLAHDYREFAYTGINSIFVDARSMNRR